MKTISKILEYLIRIMITGAIGIATILFLEWIGLHIEACYWLSGYVCYVVYDQSEAEVKIGHN